MNKKIFFDANNYLKSILITSLIIIPPLFFMFEMDSSSNDPMTSLIPLIGFPIMLIILVPVLRIIVGNNSTYIICDDALYQINKIPFDSGIMANNARAAGNLMGNESVGLLMGGLILLGNRKKRKSIQQILLEDDKLFEKVIGNTYSFKVNKTISMKRFLNGYRVVIRMSNRNTEDAENMFYIFPGYNDYDQLVECFKSLMD